MRPQGALTEPAAEVLQPKIPAELLERASAGAPEALTQVMDLFISGQPKGRARFDAFSRECLQGTFGFYTRQVSLSTPDGHAAVPTPVADRLGYRLGLASTVSKEALELLTKHDHITIGEIGGGTGALKRAVLAILNSDPKSQGRFSYVSIDINPHHRAAQSRFGGRSVEGSATEIGLIDSSVDLLFDEEVLDCLPFRVFDVDRSLCRVVREAYVRPNSGGSISWELPEADASFAKFDELYRRTGDGSRIYEFSPDYEKYWSESFRVLTPGGVRLCSDYDTMMTRSGLGGRGNGYSQVAVRLPYMVDLTHGINFAMQKILAEEAGFQAPQTKELIGLVFDFGAINRQMLRAVKPKE